MSANGGVRICEFFSGMTMCDPEIPLLTISFTYPDYIFTVKTMALIEFTNFYNDEWNFQMGATSLYFEVTIKYADIFYFDMTFSGLLELSCGIEVETVMVFSSDPGEFKFTTSFPTLHHLGRDDLFEMVSRLTGLTMPDQIATDKLSTESVTLSGVQGEKKSWFSIKLLGTVTKLAIVLYDGESQWTGFASESFIGTPFKELYTTADIQDVSYFGSAIAEGLAFTKLSMPVEVCNFPDDMFGGVLLFKPECIKLIDFKATFDISITAFTCKDSDDKLLLYPMNNAITLREILKVHASELDLDAINKNGEFFFDLRTVYNLAIEDL